MQDLVYEDPSFGIKIKYPADWKANYSEADPNAERTTIVTFSPKINSNITDGAVKVWVDNNPRTNNLALYLQNELEVNKKNKDNYTFIVSNLNSILSGYPAFSYSYITKINGKEVTNYEVGTLINGKAYEITYFAQTNKFFINLDNAYRLINSFVVIPSAGVVLDGNAISSSSNLQPLNNINMQSKLNDIKDNQSGGVSKSGGNADGGNGIMNNATTTTNNNTANSQSTGVGPQANASSKMGLPNNQSIILPSSNQAVSSNNKSPIANADTTSQTVNEGYVVLLNGSKSYDPDGDPITFSWRQIQGPSVKLDDITIATPSFAAPNVSADTKLVFELTVKDNNGLKSNSIVTITDKHNGPATNTTSAPVSPQPTLLPQSTPINTHPPIANAGQNQTVHSGDKVSLDGSKSHDPDGNPITAYSWYQLEGPSILLNNFNAASPSFAAPSVSVDTVLKFSLTVKDDKGVYSNIANVTVFVKPSANLTPTNPSDIQQQQQNGVGFGSNPTGNIHASTITNIPAKTLFCGQVIKESVKLSTNLDCTGDGLIVGADGITIDLNGHTLNGPGPKSSKIGIMMATSIGVTVQGPGVISGFQAGILDTGGQNNKITRVNLENNQIAIFLTGAKGTDIAQNMLTGNDIGMASHSASNTNFANNLLEQNNLAGVTLVKSINNKISTNTIKGSINGIFADKQSTHNQINTNTLMQNTGEDINNADGLAITKNKNTFLANNCNLSIPGGLCINSK